jgi:hypothetical protein
MTHGGIRLGKPRTTPLTTPGINSGTCDCAAVTAEPLRRRPRPHPAVRPRDQAAARRRAKPPETARPRSPLARMATPPPGPIPLVPPTRTPGTQLRPGQLAIGCCSTASGRVSNPRPEAAIIGSVRSVSQPLLLLDQRLEFYCFLDRQSPNRTGVCALALTSIAAITPRIFSIMVSGLSVE